MAKKKKQKKKNTPSKQPVVSRPKEFLDLIAPAAVKFNTKTDVEIGDEENECNQDTQENNIGY